MEYRFPNGNLIPSFQPDKCDDYMKQLLPVVNKHRIDMSYSVSLTTAAFGKEHGLSVDEISEYASRIPTLPEFQAFVLMNRSELNGKLEHLSPEVRNALAEYIRSDARPDIRESFKRVESSKMEMISQKLR